jgi:hypothetical protein
MEDMERTDSRELEIVRLQLDALMDARRLGHLTIEDQLRLSHLMAKENLLLNQRRQ